MQPPEIKIRSLTMLEAQTLRTALQTSLHTESKASTQSWAAEIMLTMIPKLLYQEKPE